MLVIPNFEVEFFNIKKGAAPLCESQSLNLDFVLVYVKIWPFVRRHHFYKAKSINAYSMNFNFLFIEICLLRFNLTLKCPNFRQGVRTGGTFTIQISDL